MSMKFMDRAASNFLKSYGSGGQPGGDKRTSLFVSSPKGLDDKIVREAAIQMATHFSACSATLSQDLKELDLNILGLLSADIVCFVGAWETAPECQLHWLVARHLDTPVFFCREGEICQSPRLDECHALVPGLLSALLLTLNGEEAKEKHQAWSFTKESHASHLTRASRHALSAFIADAPTSEKIVGHAMSAICRLGMFLYNFRYPIPHRGHSSGSDAFIGLVHHY